VSPVLALVGCSTLAVGGATVAWSGWGRSVPSLDRTLARIEGEGRRRSSHARWGFVRSMPGFPTEVRLRLVGRSPDQHAVRLVLSAAAGLVAPVVLVALARSLGLVGQGRVVPVLAPIVGAVLGPLIVQASTDDAARRASVDLRHQVSAYLDVVTMLLAGNTGYEGALEQAAHAGDGRLFVELRRRMRESGARGASLTEALHRTGAALGVDELEQVAGTAALSASEGAPVARTLAAKCATLRSTLASEQEAEARLRTSRLTTPIVGMALIFMALVIYPALHLT
jgi:tight adherence protein C